MSDTTYPEHTSIVAFVEYLLDEDRETFTPGEAQAVAEATKTSTREVLAELRSYGLVCVENRKPRVRGFTTSSNDRYFGPGSEPMHGGSGWVQINGFATQDGY